MIGLIRSLLQNCIDRIDAGNSNISADEEIEIIEAKIDAEIILNENNKYSFDFSDVKGQENVKRALEIAAAGGHNVLLIRFARVWQNYACKKNTINITRFDF